MAPAAHIATLPSRAQDRLFLLVWGWVSYTLALLLVTRRFVQEQ